jgi:hypothetical protein
MEQDFEQLSREYIEALRPVVAEVRQWWAAHCSYPHTEDRPFEEMAPFHRRWPVGPAGHPSVLAVFREYYFRVWDLNDHFAAEREAGMPVAGEGEPPPVVRFLRPMDLLVNDLQSAEPDLFDVMQGLVYVPIGRNPLHDEEC